MTDVALVQRQYDIMASNACAAMHGPNKLPRNFMRQKRIKVRSPYTRQRQPDLLLRCS